LGSTSLAGPLGLQSSTRQSVQPQSQVITVVERALTDVVVDVGDPGDSIGDSLAFGNSLFNAANTNKVGHDQGSCVRTKVGVAWECSWTNFLAGGHITVQGPFYDDGRDSMLSITGGTGAFRDADGQMLLHFRNAAGTEFDFTFMIQH
jgi:hypothetical protein